MSSSLDVELSLVNGESDSFNVADLLGGQVVKFHTEAVNVSDGNILTVGANKTLVVEVFGTSTSRTVVFYGVGASGTKRALMGINLSSFETGIQTTVSGELWQFDITGLTSVIMALTSVVGGNVSVEGRVIA